MKVWIILYYNAIVEVCDSREKVNDYIKDCLNVLLDEGHIYKREYYEAIKRLNRNENIVHSYFIEEWEVN